MIKIGIGTAQFGLRYGVNNTEGIPDLDEIRNILNTARDNDVQIIDTAISYGDAHIKLGRIGVKDFKIATKIPRIEEKTESKIRHNIMKSDENTLTDLKIESIHRLFLHHSDDYVNHKIVVQKTIDELKAAGKIEEFGISIYRPNDIIGASKDIYVDAYQVPMNLLDRTL